ncbi:hypothetical protein BGZ58_010019 [Dissophora ornata]|nr:hypothetical protein BGZ58_010019 [Dissophora ornata]
MSDAEHYHGGDQGSRETSLYLGLDLSTQQLKVIALHHASQYAQGQSLALEVHSSFTVHFDTDLDHYLTRGGVTVHPEPGNGDGCEDRGVFTTPVLMWVEALELVLDKMKKSGFPFERVRAISGAAQQHGSVYWSSDAQESFRKMRSEGDHKSPLIDVFKDAFTVYHSPIWQDTSTTAQCQEIEEFLGSLDHDQSGAGDKGAEVSTRLLGQQRLADMTGSRAYERYTGSQILKIAQKNPQVYSATERISLVSSFLASVLMAQYAMIDVADGSGMNLLNIETKNWDPLLTKFIGQGGALYQDREWDSNEDTLATKLGPVDVNGTAVQGVLCRWFVERYGFRPGDNPATVMAMRAEQGDAIVSLGTSDTLLLYTNNHGSSTLQSVSENKSNEESHQTNARLSIGYLCHPVDPRGYLMLYCAKNGSLARERVRDMYADGSWSQFNRYLEDGMKPEHSGPKEASSRIGFYFFDREIWPPVKGVYRFEGRELVDEFGPQGASGDNKNDRRGANVLAICESQFLAMRIRSSQGHLPSKSSSASSLSPPCISRILATGGASSNPAILQLLSNVFGVPVVSTNQSEQKGAGSAAWGAARKAFLFGGHAKNSAVTEGSDEESIEKHNCISPDLEQTRKYVDRIPEFVRLEGVLQQAEP